MARRREKAVTNLVERIPPAHDLEMRELGPMRERWLRHGGGRQPMRAEAIAPSANSDPSLFATALRFPGLEATMLARLARRLPLSTAKWRPPARFSPLVPPRSRGFHQTWPAHSVAGELRRVSIWQAMQLMLKRHPYQMTAALTGCATHPVRALTDQAESSSRSSSQSSSPTRTRTARPLTTCTTCPQRWPSR